MSDLTVRPFTNQYLRAVLKLTYGTWFDVVSPKSVAKIGNYHFIVQYLLKAHEIQVVTTKDEKAVERVVGVFCIQSPSTKPYLKGLSRLSHKVGYALSELYLCCNSKALSVRIFDDLFFINYAKMRRMVPKSLLSQPELTLLVTDPKCVGKGIGRKMVEVVREWCQQQDYHEYFLLTDSSCNYGFYDKLEMERVEDVPLSFNVLHVKGYDHYLNCVLRGYIYRDHVN